MGDFVGRLAANPDATLQGSEGDSGGGVYVVGGTATQGDGTGGLVELQGGPGGGDAGTGGSVTIASGAGGAGAGQVSLGTPEGAEVHVDPLGAGAGYSSGSVRLNAISESASLPLLLDVATGLTLNGETIGTQAANVDPASPTFAADLVAALIASGLMAAP